MSRADLALQRARESLKQARAGLAAGADEAAIRALLEAALIHLAESYHGLLGELAHRNGFEADGVDSALELQRQCLASGREPAAFDHLLELEQEDWLSQLLSTRAAIQQRQADNAPRLLASSRTAPLQSLDCAILERWCESSASLVETMRDLAAEF